MHRSCWTPNLGEASSAYRSSPAVCCRTPGTSSRCAVVQDVFRCVIYASATVSCHRSRKTGKEVKCATRVKAHVKSGGGDMLGRMALPMLLPSRCEIASQENLSVLTGL